MLAQHRQAIARLIGEAIAAFGADASAAHLPIELERPRAAAHGDAACNIALQAAKLLKKNPREVAQAIAANLKLNPQSAELIAAVEVAGPGFINLRLAAPAQQAVVRLILQEGDRFGCATHPADARVLVEFVSANPTGPLHVGHARQAALGDALGNVLATQGWQVMREFYYNDAGVQINNLALSVQARARELQGESLPFPEAGYRGDYIIDIARDFLAGKTHTARDGQPVQASGDVNHLDNIRHFAVAYLRQEQDRDLEAFGVRFDNFYLESSLYSDSKVDAAVKAMIASGKTFEADGALWLKTTEMGDVGNGREKVVDDKDRVMRKSDGTYTYFVPDVAYHITKWQRGFSKAINVQGSDHHGTVARVRAGLQAAGQAMNLPIAKGFPDYLLHKMVRVMRGGEEVKMSKRAGSYVTLRDLLDWVGRDAARFFLVSRKGDAEFVFDVDLALSQSEENPVYYVQYAHARIHSVLAQAAERGAAMTAAQAQRVNLTPLTGAREQTLLTRLAEFGDVLQAAANDLAPHTVASYLRDLAADFHGFYNAERVLVDDTQQRDARLALLLATAQVLRNGLALLGVSAPERM